MIKGFFNNDKNIKSDYNQSFFRRVCFIYKCNTITPVPTYTPKQVNETTDIYYKICFVDVPPQVFFESEFDNDPYSTSLFHAEIRSLFDSEKWHEQDGTFNFDATDLIFRHIQSQVASLNLNFNFILKRMVIEDVPIENIETIVTLHLLQKRKIIRTLIV